MIDQRRQSRAAAATPAVISFRDRAQRVTMLRCLMQDESSEGARVVLREPYVVPFEFTFTAAGGPPRKARKVWVKVNEMGLQFTG